MIEQQVYRLRSNRAPYNRGGVHFASTRESVEVDAGLLTEAQLEKLRADPAVSVELVMLEIEVVEADPAVAEAAELAEEIDAALFSATHTADPAAVALGVGVRRDAAAEGAAIAARSGVAPAQPDPLLAERTLVASELARPRAQAPAGGGLVVDPVSAQTDTYAATLAPAWQAGDNGVTLDSPLRERGEAGLIVEPAATPTLEVTETAAAPDVVTERATLTFDQVQSTEGPASAPAETMTAEPFASESTVPVDEAVVVDASVDASAPTRGSRKGRG